MSSDSWSRAPGTPRKRKALLATLVLVVALAGGGVAVSRSFAAAAPALQQQTSPSALPGSFADLVEQVKPAVVNISTTGKAPAWQGPSGQESPFPPGSPYDEFFKHFFENQPGNGSGVPMREIHALGSGFVIDPAGYVVTNNHVIDGADQITVILDDGKQYDGTLVGTDEKTDLALLKIDAGHALPYVKFGDSSATRVGDWVVAVGDPFGLGGTVTAGIVSARGRDLQSGPYDDFLQIDAPINRGNSGGPLFNSKGEVIGINSAIYSPNGGNIGIGFAIPSKEAKPVLDQLHEHGYVARGWLGVGVQPVTSDVADSLGMDSDKAGGALVASVTPDSPAAKAGIRPGDVITAYDGRSINELRDLPRLVAEDHAGDKVSVEVWRDGGTRSMQVVIAASPDQKQVASAGSDQSGSAEQGGDTRRLGLTVMDLTPAVRQQYGLPDDTHGVLVVGVDDGSSAGREGIRPGDVIEMVGQKKVSSSGDIAQEVKKAAHGKRKSVLLLVKRSDTTRFVVVPVGKA